MPLFLHKCKKSCTFVTDFEIGALCQPLEQPVGLLKL